MSDATAALEKTLVDACLEAGAGEALARDLRGYLEARGVQAQDIDAIEHSPRRLAVYRSLVRNGLLSVISRLMPRTRARMNALCNGRFDADFARFLHERAPRTHYLRDVPSELFEWARPLWASDTQVPSYLIDLGRHELTAFAVASVGAPPEPPLAEIDFERPVVLSLAMRLERYAWAVHELSEDPEALEPPLRRDIALVGYRDDEDAVRWLELTPLAAAILERLVAGDPLGLGVARACAEQGARADLADIARLLADLGDRGIVRGGAPG